MILLGHTEPKVQATLSQVRGLRVCLGNPIQLFPVIFALCLWHGARRCEIDACEGRRTMRTIQMIRGLALTFTVGAVMFLGAGATSEAGNRCTDHCADIYKVKRDACKLIPFKTERKICERRAKEAKEDCKHRCR